MNIPFLDGYQASVLSADWLRNGDGRHFENKLNQMVANWYTSRSPAEIGWDNIQHDALLESRNASERPILVPFSCDTLTDLLNAVLVATVSNRQLLWARGEDPSLPCRLTVPRHASNTNNLTLKESNKLVLGKADDALDVTELSKYVSSPESPIMQQIQLMYKDGAEFVRGLILSDVLGMRIETMLPTTIERIRTKYGLESYNSVVLAVHEYSATMKPNLHPCIDHFTKLANVVTNTTSLDLNCNVIFVAEENAKEWADTLHDRGCTALVLPNTSTHTESQTDYGLFSFLDNIDLLAGLAYDGYILPGNKTYLEASLLQDMMHYARSRHARRDGMLPIDFLPFCFTD
jgi:hypothetical protein